MQQLVQSGYAADIILAIMVGEAVVVLYLLRARGVGTKAGFLGNLIAGASLVLALKFALQGMEWSVITLLLVVALAGHLVDLLWRLTVARRPT